jgi:xanthine/CO dehydrogenase XdhC/CoxF family maturation factor
MTLAATARTDMHLAFFTTPATSGTGTRHGTTKLVDEETQVLATIGGGRFEGSSGGTRSRHD